MEREITEPIDIADARGRLRPEAIGWARHPVQRCALSTELGRVARWNYWCFSTRSCALTVLVADVGYLGGALVSFLDYQARRPVERLYARPGGLGCTASAPTTRASPAWTSAGAAGRRAWCGTGRSARVAGAHHTKKEREMRPRLRMRIACDMLLACQR